MMSLKQLRTEKKLTQKQAAVLAGISLRSYKSYENDESKRDSLKYRYLVSVLSEVNPIDEEHGILTLEDIAGKCAGIFAKYDVRFCYLFGSYAKGTAKPASDVDLLLSADVTGLKFFGLVEELRAALKKRTEVLDFDQLKDNPELMGEILKDGIKIYG